jgi:hypothetical protein
MMTIGKGLLLSSSAPIISNIRQAYVNSGSSVFFLLLRGPLDLEGGVSIEFEVTKALEGE